MKHLLRIAIVIAVVASASLFVSGRGTVRTIAMAERESCSVGYEHPEVELEEVWAHGATSPSNLLARRNPSSNTYRVVNRQTGKVRPLSNRTNVSVALVAGHVCNAKVAMRVRSPHTALGFLHAYTYRFFIGLRRLRI